MPRVPIALNTDDLIRRYAAGESCQDLTHAFGVSDTTLRRRLKACGVEIRQGPSYRTTDTMATREKRAATRERLELHAGPHEYVFAKLLDAEGMKYIQQRAFGPYNVDFALVGAPVTVEVVAGSGDTRAAALRRERIEYFLEAGWSVVEVFCRWGRDPVPFTARATQYIHAFANTLGSEPSGRGQHRMIRADGETFTPRSRQVD